MMMTINFKVPELFSTKEHSFEESYEYFCTETLKVFIKMDFFYLRGFVLLYKIKNQFINFGCKSGWCVQHTTDKTQLRNCHCLHYINSAMY